MGDLTFPAPLGVELARAIREDHIDLAEFRERLEAGTGRSVSEPMAEILFDIYRDDEED